MTQPDPKHLPLTTTPASPKTIAQRAQLSARRIAPPLALLLMIAVPCYVISARSSADPAVWSPANEVAPLPPPLTRTRDRTDTAIARPIMSAGSGRPGVDDIGGDTGLVGDGMACSVAGRPDIFHEENNPGTLCERIHKLRGRLQEHRAHRRAARRERLAHHPLLEAIRERRAPH